MVKHYLKLGNELICLYKNHLTFTKDLHTFLHIFKINFEFNQKLNYLGIN